MRITITIVSLMLFATCLDVSAGASIYRAGIIIAVDRENKTITVQDKETNAIRKYTIPKRVNVFDTGINRNNPSYLVPGQEVTLKLKQADFIDPDQNLAPLTRSMNLTGKVVSINRITGKGTLRESGSNRIIPFHLAEDIPEEKIPMAGDSVDFIVTMENTGLTSTQEQAARELETDDNQVQTQAASEKIQDVQLPEIKITSRMLEAGLDAFYNRNTDSETVEDIVTRIYRAMTLEANH